MESEPYRPTPSRLRVSTPYVRSAIGIHLDVRGNQSQYPDGGRMEKDPDGSRVCFL